MKICLPNVKNPKSGKGFFILRLAGEFSRMGIPVTHNVKEPHDILLHNVRIKIPSTYGKDVVRIDGVYHNTAQDYHKKNAGIREAIKKAHGIVYQSEFSRKMGKEYLGESEAPTAVIHNGADPGFYKDLKPFDGVKADKIFVAVSKWRPHKRLRDILAAFMMAEIPGSFLLVAGELKNTGMSKKALAGYFSEKNITHVGRMDQKMLGQFYLSACAVIHLCWFDSCPNSVVEAICAGCPVICNNTGGTIELVERPKGFNGLVIPVDKEYDLKPVDLWNPPSIDLSEISNAMWFAAKHKINVLDPPTIQESAKKYLELFKKVLK